MSATRAPTITQAMLDLCSALCKARRCATTAHARGLRALTAPPRRSRLGHYVMVGDLCESGDNLYQMRLVTWNCRVGGFRSKAKWIAPLQPDVLVVQEVEAIDNVQFFAGDGQPTFRDRIADHAFPRRATAVFSYTDTRLTAVDVADPMHEFRRYNAQHGDLTFQVVAVWPWATKSRATSYMQAHVGLQQHAEWIRQRPTVILGDFNDNASYTTGNWQRLLALLQPLELVSAYHEYFREPFGAETRKTHFHRGRQESAFHLDYCFLPKTWAESITSVQIGAYDEWHTISDHAPLIVDLVP